jgi:hypothetical protein
MALTVSHLPFMILPFTTSAAFMRFPCKRGVAVRRTFLIVKAAAAPRASTSTSRATSSTIPHTLAFLSTIWTDLIGVLEVWRCNCSLSGCPFRTSTTSARISPAYGRAPESERLHRLSKTSWNRLPQNASQAPHHALTLWSSSELLGSWRQRRCSARFVWKSISAHQMVAKK